MPTCRFLLGSWVLLVVACRSPRGGQSAPDQLNTAQSGARLSQDTRPPCDSPYRCKDWLIQAHGAGRAPLTTLFGASFRSLGDTVVLWFDSASGSDQHAPVWFALDTLGIVLEPKELLAHSCGLIGKDRDDQTVAVVRDTMAAKYPTPRLAWRFDVGAGRIRPISPDSVHCKREFAGE